MNEGSEPPISSLPIAVARGRHVVQFYDGDSFLLDEVARFLEPAAAGGAILVIASPAHRRGLEARLLEMGVDVHVGKERGWLASLDASETLARVSIDGWPSAERFGRVIGGALDGAGAR